MGSYRNHKARFKLNILFTDRDQDLASLIKKFLELANHDVTYIPEREHTLFALAEKHFDILIVSVPSSTVGEELVQNVRNLNGNIPIFFLITDVPKTGNQENVVQKNSRCHLIPRSFIMRDLLREIDDEFPRQRLTA